MDQPTFSDLEYDGKKRKTRREIFLERMDSLIPWDELEERIRPFYPKAGRGRRPYELSVMLRIHCVQLFYNLSDPGMEDMLYEVESVRRFVGLRLSGPLPDETTILNFRHLLEEHELGQGLFEETTDVTAWADQPDNGRSIYGGLTWAKCAQIRDMCDETPRQSRLGQRQHQSACNRRADIPVNTPSVHPIQLTRSCSEVP